MKATRLLGLTLVCAICGVLFFQWVNHPPDPIYKGQPLSYWFTRFVTTPPNLSGRPEFDSNAVPYLVSQILKPASMKEKCYRIVSPKFPKLAKTLHLEPAIPNTRRRSFAAMELAHLAGQIDPKTISFLSAELENSDPEIRWRIGGVIGASSHFATNQVQLLERSLEHKDPEVRAWAMTMVGRLPRNDKILNMITNNCRMSDARCRDAALQLIERMADTNYYGVFGP